MNLLFLFLGFFLKPSLALPLLVALPLFLSGLFAFMAYMKDDNKKKVVPKIIAWIFLIWAVGFGLYFMFIGLPK